MLNKQHLRHSVNINNTVIFAYLKNNLPLNVEKYPKEMN
jgi:hypothetical protein